MIKRAARGNPIPAYYQLQKTLQDRVEAGELEPGQRIPSERELANEYGVSVGTVTKAILNLVQEGYFYRKQGSGTFVAGTTLRRESLRYYRLIKDFGGREADLEMRLLGIQRVKPSGHVTHNLRIGFGEGLYELRRLFLSEKKPTIYSISYLPQKMFPGLDRLSSVKFERVTLYEMLEEDYGITTVANQEMLSGENAGFEVAGVLRIPEGTPLLKIDMLAFSYKERPYELRTSHCVTRTRKIYRAY